MGIDWNLYNKRLTINGDTERDRSLNSLKQTLTSNIVASLSCKDVLINNSERKLVINSSTNQYMKNIQTLPDDSLLLGDYVEWNKQFWLVTKADVDDEVYIDGEMKLCNCVITIQDDEGMIYEYPSVDSGASGSGEDESKTMTYGKTVHTITLPYDEITIKLRSTDTKSCRFYLDRYTNNPIPYKVVDNNNTSLNYGEKGLVVLTVEQDVAQDTDRPDLGICNYFEPTTTPAPQPNQSGILSKISYKSLSLIVGSLPRNYTASFTDANGNTLNLIPKWSIISSFNSNLIKQAISGNTISLSVADDDLIGEKFDLVLTDDTGNNSTSITIDIEPM